MLVKMKLYWTWGRNPKSKNSCPYKRRIGHRVMEEEGRQGLE
jgi:hypothetical protein